MDIHKSIVALRGQERQLLVAGAAIVVFAAYAFFPAMTSWQRPIIFNSPDEMANFFFAHQWSEGVGLRAPEPLDAVVGNIIHPRSVTVINGNLAPASFIGLPILFGSIAIFLGEHAIFFVTPLLTVIALFALWSCWRRIFGAERAALATVIAALHPALWYFASRGFFPNVLFVDLAIFSWWGLNQIFAGKHFLEWSLFTSIMVALALLVRTVEVIWFLPLILFALYKERRLFSTVERRNIIALAIFGVVLLGLALFYKDALVGYHVAAAGHSLLSQIGHGLLALLFPFGFHPLNIVTNVFFYALVLCWPLTLLVLLGLCFDRQQLRKPYFYAAFFLTIVLCLYYGSATIQDSVGINALSIGNSFARYWLPIYLIWLPWAAQALETITKFFSTRRHAVLLTLLLMLSVWSFVVVFFDATEGLSYVAARLESYRAVHDAVIQATGDDAVIVTERADKIFFPDRRVISPGDRPALTFPEVINNLPHLVDLVPVYYYLPQPLSPTEQAILQADRLYLGHALPLPNGAALYPLVHL